MAKIAIVGSAASSVNLAPFDDSSWSIWGLGPERRRVSLYFDVHDHVEQRPETIEFFQKDCRVPVMVLKPQPDYPTALPYPVDVLEKFSGYFTSSIAYMVALAIVQNPDEIGIWGVDMAHSSEYAYQRPCLEYLIGYAKGQGIKVFIPQESALCKAHFQYGKDLQQQVFTVKGITPEYLLGRINEYDANIQALRKDLLMFEGARRETVTILEHLKHYQRGGALPQLNHGGQ